jgi:tripartite-type tricarboxylate transporter receptor subunit TctC
MNPALFGRTPFDVQRDLAPITLAVTVGIILVAHPSLPARDFTEFLALARAQPGRINYASPGNGTPQHVDMEVLKRAAGIDLVHVPYRGGAPATLALLANEAQVLMSGSSAVPHIQAGTMRALATAGLRRSSLLPDVPTMAEAGLPGYAAESWLGILAPAKTPRAVIDRLTTELRSQLTDPRFTERLSEQGFEAVVLSGAEANGLVASETARWADVIRRAGITLR